MDTKRALVTGVTSGIGREVALGLVRQGYDLIVIARNKAKVDALRHEAQALRADVQIDDHLADLSLVAETQAALHAIAAKVERIDLLYFSAGLVPNQITLTPEGIEKCFAISYLTRVVITEAMLPALLQSDDKLLIAVASPGMKATVDFDDVNFQKRPFKTLEVMGQFQHANDVYFTQLVEKHRSDGLRAYVYHPGIVDTPIHQNFTGFVGFMMRYLMWPMKISAERSASVPLQVVDGSLAPDTHFFDQKGKSLPIPDGVRDEAYRERVVAFSHDLVQRAMEAADA